VSALAFPLSPRSGLVTEASAAIVKSKLRPRRLSGVIERKKLLAQLHAGRACKLTTLIAPSGSGKSTLLNQWYRRSAQSQAVAWFCIDNLDNEPDRFFAYLSAAIRGATVPIDFSATSSPTPSPTFDLGTCASSFVQALSATAQPLTVILDDFHVICDRRIVDVLAFVIRHAPSQVRWMIAGRGLPDFSISELRLTHELCAIDRAALNFDCDSILQLSRMLDLRDLAADDAQRVLEFTEGWATGVKLALLARLTRNPNVTERFDAEEASQCDVAQYLATTVLHEQSPKLRDFLIATSVVDRLNGDLCNALLGGSDGQATLEHLDAAQLFIQPLDNQNHWYRYHTSFRGLLLANLHRESPEKVALLHVTASRWYAEHELLTDALGHAFAGNNRSWCVELTSRCAKLWQKTGEVALLLHWTEKLTSAERRQRESLAAAHIAGLILCRRFHEASTALREAHLAAPPLDSADGNCSRSRLQTLRLMLNILSDADLATNAELPDPIGPTDVYLSGTLLTLQSYWLLQRHRFDAARLKALRACDIFQSQRSVFGVGQANVLISMADRAQGDLDAVVERCERTYAAVKKGNRGPAWVNAAAVLANLRYEQNRLPEAQALCVEVLPLLSSASTTENLAGLHTTLARVYVAQAKHDEALRLLDRLHSSLDECRHRRFLASICHEKILLHHARGDTRRADAVAQDFCLHQLAARGEWSSPREYSAAWDRLGVAYCLILLRASRYVECRAILSVLIQSAHQIGYQYRVVALRALGVVCEWQSDHKAAALASLNDVWSLTPKFGFSRSTFDEVPGLHTVVGAAIHERSLRHSLPVRYLEKFRSILAPNAVGRRNAQMSAISMLPLEPLTDREIDMLRQLARGLSNQEISNRSAIALSTTKWHLKNVFAKLDVASRTGAIARARDLQLID
jgi:LuxR family maltose regulon positive regulatory protein